MSFCQKYTASWNLVTPPIPSFWRASANFDIIHTDSGQGDSEWAFKGNWTMSVSIHQQLSDKPTRIFCNFFRGNPVDHVGWRSEDRHQQKKTLCILEAWRQTPDDQHTFSCTQTAVDSLLFFAEWIKWSNINKTCDYAKDAYQGEVATSSCGFLFIGMTLHWCCP